MRPNKIQIAKKGKDLSSKIRARKVFNELTEAVESGVKWEPHLPLDKIWNFGDVYRRSMIKSLFGISYPYTKENSK